jgi:hypothetical protein
MNSSSTLPNTRGCRLGLRGRIAQRIDSIVLRQAGKWKRERGSRPAEEPDDLMDHGDRREFRSRGHMVA